MKKEINLITFNIDNINKNHHKKINYKDYYYIGPWCEGNPFYLKKLKQKKILNLYDPKSVKKKTKDVQYIESIYEKYAPYFAKNLNIIHKRKYGKKFWKLFLDRWLRAYIADVYSKWKLVEVLSQKHVIKKFPILEMSEEHFIPQNTWHHNTIIKSQDTLFSHFVLSKVLLPQGKLLTQLR